MSYLAAIILGAVEGITEFLPISSTGHLILSAHLLHLADSDFLKTFEIFIQLGSVLAVLTLYGKALLRSWELIKRVVVAFIPTGIAGLLLYHYVKQLLGDPGVVIWALLLGGIFLIAFEHWHHESADGHEDLAKLPYKKAFWIGVAQCLAMVPGVSRAGATIVAGLSLGMSRRAVVEFSFLLALPTVAAATLLDLYKSRDLIHGSDAGLLIVGLLTSWVVAVFAIRWLLSYVRTRTFTGFGVYRILIALAALVIL